MATTIQVTPEFKQYLSSLKESSKQTYQEVIEKALKGEYSEKLTPEEELLKQGYLEMAEENLRIMKEFEHVDREVDELWLREN